LQQHAAGAPPAASGASGGVVPASVRTAAAMVTPLPA
jgi:hypothetical protein